MPARRPSPIALYSRLAVEQVVSLKNGAIAANFDDGPRFVEDELPIAPGNSECPRPGRHGDDYGPCGPHGQHVDAVQSGWHGHPESDPCDREGKDELEKAIGRASIQAATMALRAGQ